MTERLEEILHYYREKSDNIQNERTEWLQQLNYIKQSIQNVHLKERELMDKKVTIAEQQKALSESHIMMFDEKLHELILMKDNEELKKAEEKDRMKIKELMSLTDDFKAKPEANSVTVTDSRPKNNKKESLGIERNTKSHKESRQTYASKYKQSMQVCKNKQSGKIKTIFLPHEDVNKVRMQIDSLRQYKEQQKKLYQQCLSAYDKDKNIKNQELQLRKQDFAVKYAQLQEIVKKRNEKKESICRDYFQERHRIKNTENPSVEAFAQKLLENKAVLEKKLETEQLRLEREVAYQVEVIDKNTKDYINKYRNQVKKKGKSRLFPDNLNIFNLLQRTKLTS
jgi:hypothetical protein